jgi:hypothetical protein
MDKFTTKRRDLTRYALACGYVQLWPRNARDGFEARRRLEQYAATNVLQVYDSEARQELYCGTDLSFARKVLKHGASGAKCPFVTVTREDGSTAQIIPESR